VSIGLPVYNGAGHLSASLDSLLAQEYADFELIISDNASTDATEQICRDYARMDKRIKFFKNPTNIGAANNFNRVFSLSVGRYFMWAAHDDLWRSSYLRSCLDELKRHSEVVLCASDISFIDEDGIAVDPVEYHGGRYNKVDTRGLGSRQRVKVLTERRGWYAFYGVMRAESLRRTRLCSPVFGFDVILLMELLLLGETLILPEQLFCYRLARKSHLTYMKDITGSNSKNEPKVYTGLARALLEVIDQSSYSDNIKAGMREDLLNNVCELNEAWRADIIGENADITRAPKHYWGIEIRKLLVSDTHADDLERRRRDARRRWLAQMPLRQQIGHRLGDLLQRHVLWRFRTRSR
jgi:glycosyltransferase involved in cell wall biosynthesis